MTKSWYFALGIVVVAAVVAALVAADRAKKKCPIDAAEGSALTSTAPTSKTPMSTATSDSSDTIPVLSSYSDSSTATSSSAPLPLNWRDDGFYRTVDDTFYAAIPNSQAKPELYPNEETLDQIRREYYHYRERISNRNNLNSYQYPNKLGWWPRASYAGGVRLEPGQWPKYDNPPFSVAWRSGARPCGPDNPSTFGGPDNAGVPVNMFGRIVRRGQCVNGVADCPVGMTISGGSCVGEPARDAFGSIIWSRTEFAAPLTDVADVYTAEQLEGQPLGTPVTSYTP